MNPRKNLRMPDLRDRTRAYAVRIIRLHDALPVRGAARVLGDQIARSGTSVGAHYREAIRARSAAEYIAKLNAGLMELEETLYWLELIEESGCISARKLALLKIETGELIAIFVSLIKKKKKR
jgi:four helix bundle protein